MVTLKKVRSSKSTGLTNTPTHLLKDGADVIARPLTVLMNRSIAEGLIPSGWKHAVVTPVYKSGSKVDPTNYRPIFVFTSFQ